MKEKTFWHCKKCKRKIKANHLTELTRKKFDYKKKCVFCKYKDNDFLTTWF